MLKKCGHGQTAYSIAGWINRRYYCAEICACGTLRIFRIEPPSGGRPTAASVSLLPKARHHWGPYEMQEVERVVSEL